MTDPAQIQAMPTPLMWLGTVVVALADPYVIAREDGLEIWAQNPYHAIEKED